jgi:hypothetical protein
MYGAKSRGFWSHCLPIWQNPGKIGLWQVVGNPGNFTGPGVVHFGWFSGVLVSYSTLHCVFLFCYSKWVGV